jgi:hypothetical protein
MITNVTTAYQMLSRHGFADIMQSTITGEKSLHASAFFDAGETLSDFNAGSVLEQPTYLTVQTGEQKHITLEPEFLQYINHSCNPNVFFDTTLMKLVALREIQPGDEILFFYPSTEWDMTQPFSCFCGNTDCLQLIKGAAYLSDTEIMRYRFTDFISSELLKRKKP